MADTSVMAMAVRYTSVATRRPLSNMLFSCLMGPIRNIVLQGPSTRRGQRFDEFGNNTPVAATINQLRLVAPVQKPRPSP